MENKLKYFLVILSFILIFSAIGIKEKENIMFFENDSDIIYIDAKGSSKSVPTFTDEQKNEPVLDINYENNEQDMGNIENSDLSQYNEQTTDKKVNINTAEKEDLTALNGIGPAIADDIIAYRQEKPFENIEDIKNIKRIGDKTFEKIKDSITVY